MRIFKLSTQTIGQTDAFYVIIFLMGKNIFHLVDKIEGLKEVTNMQ